MPIATCVRRRFCPWRHSNGTGIDSSSDPGQSTLFTDAAKTAGRYLERGSASRGTAAQRSHRAEPAAPRRWWRRRWPETPAHPSRNAARYWSETRAGTVQATGGGAAGGPCRLLGRSTSAVRTSAELPRTRSARSVADVARSSVPNAIILMVPASCNSACCWRVLPAVPTY